MKPLCLVCLLGATLALAPAADPPRKGKEGKARTEQWPASGKPGVGLQSPWYDYDDPDAKPAVVDLGKLLKVEDKEVNGVLLTITPRLAVGVRYRLGIQWTIKSSGPRWPLVIMTPGFDHPTDGMTTLHCYAVGKSGKAYDCVIKSPSPPAIGVVPIHSTKEWFMELDERFGRGGVSGHDFGVVPEDLRRYFRRHLPAEFDVAKPPRLYVQLRHNPSDPGKHLGYNAWTGKLATALKPVELPEW